MFAASQGGIVELYFGFINGTISICSVHVECTSSKRCITKVIAPPPAIMRLKWLPDYPNQWWLTRVVPISLTVAILSCTPTERITPPLLDDDPMSTSSVPIAPHVPVPKIFMLANLATDNVSINVLAPYLAVGTEFCVISDTLSMPPLIETISQDVDRHRIFPRFEYSIKLHDTMYWCLR